MTIFAAKLHGPFSKSMIQEAMKSVKVLWMEIPPAWRFSLISVTLFRVFYTLWSLLFLATFPLVVQNQDFFGEPIVTIFDLYTSRAFVYSRQVNGDVLTFKANDTTSIIDLQTGNQWQLRNGQGISENNQGLSLSSAQLTPERIFPYLGVTPHPVPLLAIWQRFDANWYLTIAEEGYGNVPGDVHFPPLYPVLIRFLSDSNVFRNNFVSGLLISQISLYFMVKLLYDLFATWGASRLAEKALFFLLIFPTSFFFFSSYTEALFVVFAILCLRAIQNQKWHWAGFWIFCAVLIRLQGITLLLPLTWVLLQTRFRDVKFGEIFLAGFSPLVAMSLYLLIRARSGDPSVIPFVETNLHARIALPWENIIYSFRYIFDGLGGYVDVLNLMAFTLFGVLIVVHWKKFPIEYNLFSIASLILFSMRLVDTQPLNSLIRYLLTIFPVFYLFGLIARHKWISLSLFTCFFSLNLFLTAQFFLWGWVA
jgi:Gpi18-like mannosyltransferase